MRAAPSLGDESRGLGRDEALLGVRQELLALIKGETDRLELAMMLVEREYLRVVAQDSPSSLTTRSRTSIRMTVALLNEFATMQ